MFQVSNSKFQVSIIKFTVRDIVGASPIQISPTMYIGSNRVSPSLRRSLVYAK